jgi:hypothetical protein
MTRMHTFLKKNSEDGLMHSVKGMVMIRGRSDGNRISSRDLSIKRIYHSNTAKKQFPVF